MVRCGMQWQGLTSIDMCKNTEAQALMCHNPYSTYFFLFVQRIEEIRVHSHYHEAALNTVECCGHTSYKTVENMWKAGQLKEMK